MGDFKEKVTEAKTKAKNWCSDRYWDARQLWAFHKDEIVGVVSLGGAIVTGGVKLYDAITVRQRRHDRMSYEDRKIFYDPSTGCRYKLKRNLSNKEQMELNKLRRQGHDAGEVLQKMKVLKR